MFVIRERLYAHPVRGWEGPMNDLGVLVKRITTCAAGIRTSDHSAGAKLKYASITFVGLSLTKLAVSTELIFTQSCKLNCHAADFLEQCHTTC
jgi:hypothetical protein